MGIEIRPPGADDVAAMFAADARSFGSWFTPEEVEEQLPTMDLTRFRIAVDTPGIVGAIGSYAFDVTLPGGTTVPMGGVTWVAVAATHRRQGLLRRLMAACHDDIDARGEPVAMLSASESGIYERFGYGAASKVWVTSIERRRAQLRPDLSVDPSSVRYVDGDVAAAHVTQVWERYRRSRPGELTRSDVLHRFLFIHRSKAQDGFAPAVYLAHHDGYAVYRVAANWNDGHPTHRMEIAELVALTPDAHLALWHTLLGTDLVATITSRQLAFDDPLPYLLTDPRVVR
ncbi:MAG: GNAT family N-acetyltransferase, partial [Ilumatobacteraceae bacterium]